MLMVSRDGVIWHDGELTQWRDATTHVLTHTLHYGMGVFEGMRARGIPQNAAVFCLQAHIGRLFDSVHIMNMQIPYSRDEINEATHATVRENNLKSAYIHPMMFYGNEDIDLRVSGLKVHVIIAARSWGIYTSEEALQQGIKIRTSSFTCYHANISMTRTKSNGVYTNSVLVLQGVISDDADEVIILDPESYVAEGSGENIFVIKDGVIYTSEVIAYLSSVTRNTILTLAAGHGFKLIEKRITRDEVYIADETFFTGTAAEVMPIREVDGRRIGVSRRGSVTKKLQKAYFDLVSGRTRAHAEWRTLAK